MARHPHAKLGARVSGGFLAVVGAAGLPSDLENWGAAFQAIGSNLGRWILVIVGIGVVIAVTVLQRVSVRRASDSSGPLQEEAERAVFVAVEGEIAVAHEEAVELHRLLLDEWPYITPKGQDLEQAILDWRLKTTDFITAVLGPAHRAAFRTASAGKSNAPDRLEAEGKFLGDLALSLTPDSIRADEGDVLEARTKRRKSQAANFLEHEHYRAPGAPPAETEEVPREFGRRDDAGDLAKRCHMFAGSVERWAEGFKRSHSERAERMVEECLAADPATDPAEARRRAYTRDEKNWEADYRLKYEAEAKKLFDEAYAMGQIAKEHEQLAIAPLAIQFEAVPRLFNEIAARLYDTAENLSS